MDYLEMAKRRYSVREYQEKAVEKEKVEKILMAAHVAPTANNQQPVHILAVQSQEGLKKLAKGARFYDAPLAFVVCADPSKAWTRKYDGMNSAYIDASILTDQMMMEAQDLGLGTLWICWFKPQVIREEFQIPENWEPVNILAVGYPKGQPASPDRHETTRIPLAQLAEYR